MNEGVVRRDRKEEDGLPERERGEKGDEEGKRGGREGGRVVRHEIKIGGKERKTYM